MGIIELILLLIVVIVILALSFKITRQYERAVIFRLGKLAGQGGPVCSLYFFQLTELSVLISVSDSSMFQNRRLSQRIISA